MAIQIRRGPVIKLDPNKLSPAEFAAPLDTGELHFCFTPGETKQIVFSEDVVEIIDAHTGEVVATLTADAVSYTHLDVYKRQIFQGNKARNPNGTVNYTELRLI